MGSESNVRVGLALWFFSPYTNLGVRVGGNEPRTDGFVMDAVVVWIVEAKRGPEVQERG